jgi:hypothetical protein
MFERLIDDFCKKMERDAKYEIYDQFDDLYDSYFEVPEPFQWPTERRYHPPPAQIIPTGPYDAVPCGAKSNLEDLSSAVDRLKKELRHRPLIKKSVSEALNDLASLNKRINVRMKNHCTQQERKLFASKVRAMLRRGGLPRQARQSLQTLLN